MAIDLTVVIPTHGRAGNILTFKAVPEADVVLSVAESQVEEYRNAHPDANIDPHSDEIKGLTPKKNHIAKKFGNVFMMDDDVPQVTDLGEGGRVDPKIAVQLIHRLADQADQMPGTYLFGFNDDPVPLHYQPQRPFQLTGPISGACQGLLEGHDLWWPDDPVFGPAEDVWLSGMNAFKHRKVLKDLRYGITDARGKVGGNANTRSLDLMYEMANKLKEAYGDAIVLKEPTDVRIYFWRLKVPW